VIFHSLDFAIFFVLVVPLYWALPHRGQNLLLLAASAVFYGWIHPWLLSLVATVAVVTYASGLGMEVWPSRRKTFLWFGVFVTFGVLGAFKYFGFFAENVAAALSLAGLRVPRPALSLVLPAGISFYTFQAVTYPIDVYFGRMRARRSLVDVAAFVSFFPSLLAGPIMRASTLLPQIEGVRRFSAAAARDATLLLAWGLFKKLVIADNVGVIANKVFALREPEFHVLWAGVFAFAVQIYADFSSYADIARAVAKWLGIDLVRNFDHPYLAASPAEFWQRWHISLSTWFRDYVFLPVAYRISGRLTAEKRFGLDAATRAYAGGIMVTMLAAGLWHGAGWNYVLWGGYHGVLLALARLLAPRRGRRRRARRWLRPARAAGMFALTAIGWLFFRETDGSMILRDLALSPFQASALGRQTGAYLFFLAGLYSIPLWIDSLWSKLGGPSLTAAMVREDARLDGRLVAAQALLAGTLVAGALTLHATTSLDFIYFRF